MESGQSENLQPFIKRYKCNNNKNKYRLTTFEFCRMGHRYPKKIIDKKW